MHQVRIVELRSIAVLNEHMLFIMNERTLG